MNFYSSVQLSFTHKLNFKFQHLDYVSYVLKEIPLPFTQDVVNNCCSELLEVHGFCYNSVLILEHIVLFVKEDNTGKRVKKAIFTIMLGNYSI